MIRPLAELLVRYATGRMPASDQAWARAMQHEVDSIENDYAALHWAAGCVFATYSGRVNPMRMAPVSALLGVLILLVMVIGGYAAFGGALIILFEAFPASVVTVVLGALAATLIRTSVGGPGMFASIRVALLGRRCRPVEYRALATSLIGALDATNTGAPRTPSLSDATADQLVRDAQALVATKQIGADALDTLLRSRIAAILADQRRAVRVLQLLGASLLWFGLIGFLLGMVKTFSLMAVQPDDFGMFVAHALVGPGVGLLLAAGIIYPLANRLDTAIDDDSHFYEIIRVAFLCRLAGGDAALAVRTAFGMLPADLAVDVAEGSPSLRPA